MYKMALAGGEAFRFANHKGKLMNKSSLAYTGLTVALLLAMVHLYATGLRLKPESFGLGLSYILPGVVCIGLAIVSGTMAILEYAAGRLSVVTSTTSSSQETFCET